MKMRKAIRTAASAIGGAALAGAMLTPAVSVSAAEKIRLSTYVNEVDIRYEGFKHFADLVKEKTQGRVEVEIFPSATLHGWADGVDAVTGGVADVAWISADKRLPCYRAGAFYPAVVDLEKQIEMDARITEILADEAAKMGLVNVFSSNYSYDQEWWFKDRVADISKLEGQQVRSIGPLVSMMIEKWGGKPVFVAPKEVFQSAERGVVDGINMGVATYSSWKLWTVMPYMVNASLFYGNIMYMMNKNKFDKLSAADQKAVLAAGRETEIWLKPRYEAWVNERVGDAVMKGGGAAVSLPLAESKRLVANIQPDWNKELLDTCPKDTAEQLIGTIKSYSR